MTATVQGVLLVALFVVPGFVHYRFAKTRRVWQTDEKFEITVVFASLGLTSLWVAVEVLTLGILAFSFGTVDERLREGFDVGLQGYGRSHSAELLVAIAGIFLFNSAVLATAGLLDPEGWVVNVIRRGKRASPNSAWYEAFRPEAVAEKRREEPRGRSKDAVLVYMKGESQPRYFGWVGAFDLDHDDQGEYYFQVWNAERWHGDKWLPIRLRNDCLSSVLLKSSELAALEFTYGDVGFDVPAIGGIRAPLVQTQDVT